MKHFKKIELLLCCFVCLLSSCDSNEEFLCSVTDRIGINHTIDELYEASDYVYHIKIDSMLGEFKYAYQCTTWRCWGFEIIDVFKEIKPRCNYFFIEKHIYDPTFSEIEGGKEYYIFLFNLSYKTSLVDDWFIACTYEEYEVAIQPIL